jgi:cardiolipin synthase
MTWATRITIFRIILIPIFIGLMVAYGNTVEAGHAVESWRYGAIAVFIVASLSDALDGYLARHWNQRSALGALLDPVADKLLLLAVLVTFGLIPPRYFPLWFTVIILSRDALLLLGYFVVRHFLSHVDVKPTGPARSARSSLSWPSPPCFSRPVPGFFASARWALSLR